MRFVNAFVKIEFDFYKKEYQKEFDKLGSESTDPIGQYIKLAKARGDTRDIDPVLLELLIALHRKIDDLSAYIKNEKQELLKLKFKSETLGVGFEYFKIKDNILKCNEKYYGRFMLPVFPQRLVPVIFEGESENIAKIVQMHEKDEKDYNAFIMARERAIIREMRGKNE